MSTLGVKTFQEIQDAASALTQTPLSSSLRSAVAEVINISLEEAYSEHDWPQLYRESRSTLRRGDAASLALLETSDASVPILPEASTLISMHLSNQDGRIEIVSPSEFHERVGGTTIGQTGTPEIACVAGNVAQYREIATAGTPTLKSSSSANDSTLVPSVLYANSTDTLGGEAWEDVNGTFSGAGVAMAESAAAGYSIKAVMVPSGWAGDLTIEVGGTEVVKIDEVRRRSAAGSTATRLYSGHLLKVWPVPSTDDQATLLYRYRPPRLTETNDVPLIPVAGYLTHKAAAAIHARVSRDMDQVRHHEGKAEISLRKSWRERPTWNRRVIPQRNVYGMFGMDRRGWTWS